MNFVDHLLFYMKLLNYLFCDMFGSVLECYELTHISWLSTPGNHAWVNRHCYPIGCVIKSTHQGICSCSPIVPFHKSQCALRYRDPMSKTQNTSSQRSLATWLTVAANEQNDDWPASVSLVSDQPVIGWLKDEVARHWSHIVHRPRPNGNLPLPCIVKTVNDIVSNIFFIKIILRATNPPR